MGQQIEGGLQHTDVRLDAGEDDLGPGGTVEAVDHFGNRAAAKRNLGRPRGQPLRQLGHGRSEALGILLRGLDW